MAVFPLTIQAQTQASLGAGVGTVRYAGGSSFSAGTLSPTVQRLSPSFYVGATGSLSALEAGVWATQTRVDLWGALHRVAETGPRVAVGANFATSTRSDGAATGSATLIVEALWTRGRGGAAIGAGPQTGVVEGERGIGAPHLRARGWWMRGPAQVSLTVEPIRFDGAWFTDVVGGASLDRGRVVGSAWISARLSAAYGSKGAASAALQYFVSPSVALEGSAGSYLADPFQGFPRAGFVTIGVRAHAKPRSIEAAPSAPRLKPLVAEPRGDSVVVRFRMSGARSVSIAGDWNDWKAVPLRGLGNDVWEGAMVLAAGTYHFNLLVDGSDWVVPGGVAVVSDGMGGMVAVLTVL